VAIGLLAAGAFVALLALFVILPSVLAHRRGRRERPREATSSPTRPHEGQDGPR
jgi:hypothetical protein